MKMVTATLIKLATDDNMVTFLEGIEVGKTYEIDLDTRQVLQMYNVDHQKIHAKEVVRTASDRWLPVECLTWEGKDKVDA